MSYTYAPDFPFPDSNGHDPRTCDKKLWCRRRRAKPVETSWTAVQQTWNWVIGSAGQWVIWVIFHGVCISAVCLFKCCCYVENKLSLMSGSPGHRVIILTRCETRVFPVFEKMPKMQNVHLKCWNDKSHCQVSVVGLKSLDVSPCDELLLLPMIIKNSLAWEYFFTHKSTFWVHYRTGSLGHWFAGSQNVTQFNLCCTCC